MRFLRVIWGHIVWIFRGGDPPEILHSGDDFEDLDGPDGPHGRPTV